MDYQRRDKSNGCRVFIGVTEHIELQKKGADRQEAEVRPTGGSGMIGILLRVMDASQTGSAAKEGDTRQQRARTSRFGGRQLASSNLLLVTFSEREITLSYLAAMKYASSPFSRSIVQFKFSCRKHLITSAWGLPLPSYFLESLQTCHRMHHMHGYLYKTLSIGNIIVSVFT